jgi:pimeloyl-ACP methyl ester carboxylesterase
MPALAERHTVIAPDLLGHGRSAKPRGRKLLALALGSEYAAGTGPAASKSRPHKSKTQLTREQRAKATDSEERGMLRGQSFGLSRRARAVDSYSIPRRVVLVVSMAAMASR